jgi:hypothetical protein
VISYIIGCDPSLKLANIWHYIWPIKESLLQSFKGMICPIQGYRRKRIKIDQSCGSSASFANCWLGKTIMLRLAAANLRSAIVCLEHMRDSIEGLGLVGLLVNPVPCFSLQRESFLIYLERPQVCYLIRLTSSASELDSSDSSDSSGCES